MNFISKKREFKNLKIAVRQATTKVMAWKMSRDPEAPARVKEWEKKLKAAQAAFDKFAKAQRTGVRSLAEDDHEADEGGDE